MIAMMDYLLKQVRLDFLFTPYKVLPASPDDGFLEFVPSETITVAQREGNGNLHTYLTSLDSNPENKKLFSKHTCGLVQVMLLQFTC